MEIVIQIPPDVAQAFHQSEELLKTLGTFCLVLKPMHRDTNDPNLKSYFTVEVQDDVAAKRVVSCLQQVKVVTAAYIKPFDEPPY